MALMQCAAALCARPFAGVFRHVSLTWGGARAGTVVEGKVRHPGVTLLMQRDILLHCAAALSARLPGH